MRDSVFAPATREGIKLRVALIGPSGSGKTFGSLLLAHQMLGLQPGDEAAEQRIALLDTENGSSRRYAGGRPFHFAVATLRSYAPDYYVRAIEDAEQSGFEVLIIDSLSHSWSGKGGAQELVDQHAKGGNNWSGWATVTPMVRTMFETMLGCRMHILATMRAKTVWALEGKKPVKVGQGADMRAGADYEFDVVLNLDQAHSAEVDKTHCSAIDGRTFAKGDTELAETLMAWCEGEEAARPPLAEVPEPEPEQRHSDPELVKGLMAMYGQCLEQGTSEAAQAMLDNASAEVKDALAAFRAGAVGINPDGTAREALAKAHKQAAQHVSALAVAEMEGQ